MRKALIAAGVGLIALVLGWRVYVWTVEEATPAEVPLDWRPAPPERAQPAEDGLASDAQEPEPASGDEQSANSASDDRTTALKRAATVTLVGRVKNIIATESPMPQVEVKLVVAGKVHKVSVAPGQEYRLSGIPPGRARVRIEARGFEPFAEERYIPAEPPEQKLNFYLVPRDSLYVRLETPDGRPLLEALKADGTFAAPPEIVIVATHDSPGPTIPLVDAIAYSGYAVGHVVLTLKPRDWNAPNEYARIVKLPVTPPVYLSACRSSAVLATRFAPSKSGDVTLAIPLEALRASGGSAHWRIVGAEDDTPLEEGAARLDFVRDPKARTTRLAPGFSSREAGDDLPRVGGDVSLRDLDPGAYTLTVSAPGRERLRTRVQIGPGAVTELGTFRLTRTAVIEGVVTDENGPAARAHVELVPFAGEELDQRRLPQETLSDDKGHFRFEGAGSRKCVLRAHGSQGGASQPAVVDASGGDVRGLSVVLEQGVLVYFHLEPALAREAASGWEYTVAVFDDRRRLVAQRAMSDDGRVQVHLITGAYSFEATRRGTPVARGSFEVESTLLDVAIVH